MKNALKATLAIFGLFFSTHISAQAPIAAFTLNQATVCAGLPIQITDASSNVPNAWSYTVQGAGTFVTQNPTVVINSAGTYSISLIASNGSGNSAVYTETVAILALPLVSAGPSTVICEGTYITFNGSGASSYAWSNGIIDGTSFAPLSNTTYTVTGTDANGCENSAAKAVTVNPLPALSINGVFNLCLGAAVTLTVSGANTYTWDNGAHTTTLTDSPLANTVYSVTGKNTTTGCSATTGSLVTVNDLPIVYVNSGEICAGQAFTMNPGGAFSYVYSGGTATVSPASNTDYTVTGTDVNGCSASAVANVTVHALPVISVNSGSFCAGTGFTVQPAGALSYSILPGGSFQVNPATTSVYSVTGTDVNGCVSPVAAVSHVTVLTLPVITVNSGSICSGQVFTITPSGAQSYSYSSGVNTVSPLSNDIYTVIGEDSHGCISGQVSSTVTVVSLPLISANSGSVCPGNSFTIVPAGAISYTFINGANVVNPATTTSYSISGTSPEGCISDTYGVSDVFVFVQPVVSVNSGTVCSGSVFTLVAGGADTYIYQGGSATVTPALNTSYTVAGISPEGCISSNIAVASLTVISLPVLSVTAVNDTICTGNSLTLTASGASTYTWNGTHVSGHLTDMPVVSSVYTLSGSYTNGCTSTITQSVLVNPLPMLSVQGGTICQGESFTLSPSGAVSYTYSSGSAIVAPGVSTSYSIVGTDANGCISQVMAVANVSVVNAVTLTISGNTMVCSGKSVTLTANGATTYSWSTGAQTPMIALTPSVTGVYTLTGITSVCSDTAAVSVTVKPSPELIVSATASLICKGESAILEAAGADSYSWDNSATTYSTLVDPGITTSYTVTGTAANGCTDVKSISLQVNDCTGLAQQEADEGVVLYPNPGKGIFILRLKYETSVKIMNVSGQTVYTNSLNASEQRINLEDQPQGVYFVRLEHNNQVRTLKIVKN